MDMLRSKKFTFKMDNEPAMKALGREIARKRMAEAVTIMENPEMKESQSNSHAEGGGCDEGHFLHDHRPPPNQDWGEC